MHEDHRREITSLASAQHGVVHRRQLPDSQRRREQLRWLVRSGRWEQPTKDVLVIAGSPRTWDQRAWVALLEAGPGAALSHRTAAHLIGIPGFARAEIDVAQRESRDHHTEFGALHQTSWLPPHHLIVVSGWPVTSLPRTLFDLAGLTSPNRRRRGLPYVHAKRVERAVNDALNDHGLSLDALDRLLREHGRRGRPGTALMRKIVDEHREVEHLTESDLEDLLVDVLEQHGLPVPAKQVSVGGSFAVIGRVDFLYRAERVVIEVDSRKHHGSFRDTERDKWRSLDLASAGFVTVQVTWWQLKREPKRFSEALRVLLRKRRELFAC